MVPLTLVNGDCNWDVILVLNRPYLWHKQFDDVDLLDFVAFVSEHCDDVNLIPAISNCSLFFAVFDTVSVLESVLCSL